MNNELKYKRKTDNLRETQQNKDDEFYTLMSTIELEISEHLKSNLTIFKDKIVLCPCDDYEHSNFTRYFVDHFKELGLKRLVSTCYNSTGRGKYAILDKDNFMCGLLEGDGDFRSDEVTDYRDAADVIVTNPPFSLLRAFVPWLMDGSKQFLILGNINMVTYKGVFNFFKENKIWIGKTARTRSIPFIFFDSSNLRSYKTLGIARWFTNFDGSQCNPPLKLHTTTEIFSTTKHKSLKGKTQFDRYDNYDAIEIPFTDSIPSDYDGVMGVPITFIIKQCSEQFEIVGLTKKHGLGVDCDFFLGGSIDPCINGHRGYVRLFIHRR